MQILMALSRRIDALTAMIARWVSWLILASIFVSAANAVIRKAFDISSNAWLELQWYLFGAAFLLASANTLQKNEHVRIDIVYAAWPRKIQLWLDLLGHLLFLMPFTLLMNVYLVPYVWTSFQTGEGSPNAGGLIVWPAKAMLLAGFLLLSLQGVSEIIKRIGVIRKYIDDSDPFISSHEQAEREANSLANEGKR